MPLFDFKCASCNHVSIDVYKSMHSQTVEICPVCTGAMEKLPSLPHTDLKEFHRPIEMFSVAARTQEEVREIQRKCPDVQISDDPNDEMWGVPVVKNRHEKLSLLKAIGYVEKN